MQDIIKDFTELLAKGAAIVDAQTAPTYDRSKLITASEAGTCLRKQWYDKHSPPAERQSNGYARRGAYVERYVIDALEAGQEGFISDALEEQVTLMNAKLHIAGTPDGRWRVADDPLISVVLEVKSIDPRTNTSNLPRQKHILQTQINIALSQEAYPLEDIPGGILVYVDASDFDKVYPFFIEPEPGVLEKLAEGRGARVLRTRNVARLDREGRQDGQCKTCPHSEVCLGAESDGEGRKRGNRNSALDTAVQRYIAARSDEAAAKALKDEQAELIKQELRTRNAASIDVGDYSVTLSKMNGRRSLDRKGLAAAMEEVGLELEGFESIGKPFETLSIKERESA